MKQKELESKVLSLETTIRNLMGQLKKARVISAFPTYSYNHSKPAISLVDMRDQINAIKEFLNIEFVTEPEIPSKSVMKKRQNTREDQDHRCGH